MMKLITTKWAGALAAIALLGFSSGAVAQEFEFDVNHTHILYTVSHFGFSNVHGEFVGFEGTADFNPDDLEAARFDITIDTASVDSGFATRDEHMRGENWFNVAEFPTMHFVTTSVERTGETTARMVGDLTLMGETRSVALDVVLTGTGRHPFRAQQEIFGFLATGMITRSEFGMDYGLPYLGDEISLTIETEIHRTLAE